MGEEKEPMVEVQDFDKCPNCGSSNGLATTLYGAEAKKGHVREFGKYGIHEFSGPIIDIEMVKLGKVLIGTKVPFISVSIDVCQNCGALYATRIVKRDIPINDALPSNQQLNNLPFLRGN